MGAVGLGLGFGSPPPATLSPVAGMAMWLKADAGLLDGAGDPVTAGGTAVATWRDQSGNGRHATQPVALNRPTYQAASVGGRPSVRFADPSWLTYASGSAWYVGTGVAAFLVARRTSVSSGSGTLALTDDSANDYDAAACLLVDYEGDGSSLTAYRNNQTVVASNPGNGVAYQWAVEVSGTTLTGYLNGVPTSGTSTAGSFGFKRFAIGRRWAQDGYYNGDIAEALVYPTGLSAADRHAVEAYLAVKYGLPLTLDY